MYYIVASYTLKKLKLTGMGANGFYDLVRSHLFACKGLVVPSLDLEVSSVNQDQLIHLEVSCFFNMQGPSFVIDTFTENMYVVLHSSHYILPFFCSGRAEFTVVMKFYGVWIKVIEASIQEEFVGGSGYGIRVKFCERQPCAPAVLPIVGLAMEVLPKCLDCLFTESVCLRVVGGREELIDVDLVVQVFGEFQATLQITIQSHISW